jgi:hypothetical protein
MRDQKGPLGMPDEALMTMARTIAELWGRIATTETELRHIKANLTILDASVRHRTMVKTLPAPKRTQRPSEYPNLSRAILDTLRRSPEPLTALQIAEQCGADASRVLAALRYQRGQGMVWNTGDRGQAMVWRIGPGRTK